MYTHLRVHMFKSENVKLRLFGCRSSSYHWVRHSIDVLSLIEWTLINACSGTIPNSCGLSRAMLDKA
uniref:Uncharacterized protein n=1 Tax=Ulva partita TaxID=1605170 RepID=A0A1C9ZWC7_9CHLO|nr:hypothetical protein [Ulva partita]